MINYTIYNDIELIIFFLYNLPKEGSNMERIKDFLKRNDIIIDFISKIVLGIFSLILLINANDLVKEQTKAEKENTAPIFYIEKTTDLKKNNVFKLENKGGRVSHLKFERIDIFTVSVSCNKIEHVIEYANTLNEQEVNKDNVWYFSPSQQYIDTWNFQSEVQKALEERYKGRSVIVTVPSSYYKISYHDYLNDYKEDYYYDAGSYVTYSLEMSKEINKEKDTDKYNGYSLMMAIYENEKELTEQFIKMIIGYYDRYYIKEDIWA